ncbi:hypothetical protein CC1G_01857 [Coprinopsis cinerea okayama7|uniref:Methyltransferase domain-containing protein n=1 Tax=Coprinopsis cinerea (strain Okayama-7 / 130 / ATCC MYA-4618 / FGSC 9003) TaxID=240176 RepID=D6RK45_COPC7|nr:hypothetical protein CC1G_01857 [Coprinopsis cinerea okayama7\|eukprot:XP_002912175.1 hypothetical protein CC1G_01857 [Coprinopsis cinerea okayama7\
MLQPSFPSAIPSHPPHSSGSSSFDIKRHTRTKELQFLRKYGHRHHSYDNEKAPYPLSYDKHVLEMEALDNRLTQHLRGSSSFVNFDESPARVLDLGCGTGTWVVDAAKEWPNAEFVGFDLVNVQVPLKLLDPSIAKRITWRHGNLYVRNRVFVGARNDDGMTGDQFNHEASIRGRRIRLCAHTLHLQGCPREQGWLLRISFHLHSDQLPSGTSSSRSGPFLVFSQCVGSIPHRKSIEFCCPEVLLKSLKKISSFLYFPAGLRGLCAQGHDGLLPPRISTGIPWQTYPLMITPYLNLS